jgi:hypothetical protein
MAGKRRKGLGDADGVEYPPIEMEGLMDGLMGFLPTMDEVKGVGVAGVSCGLGMIALDEAFDRVAFLAKHKRFGRPLAKVVVGLVGGKALFRWNSMAGAGLSAGLVGDAIRDTVNAYILKKGALADLGAEDDVLLGDEDLLGEDDLLGQGDDYPLLGEGDDMGAAVGASAGEELRDLGAAVGASAGEELRGDEDYIVSGMGY